MEEGKVGWADIILYLVILGLLAFYFYIGLKH